MLDRPVREGHVVAGHAEDRPLEVEDRLLGDHGGDLGAEARDARGFLHHDHAPGLAHGREDRLLVQRLEAADVHDLRARVQLLGRLEAGLHHGAVGDERDIAAFAGDPRLPERHDVLALGHLAARAAVEGLRLHDHDGIRVADRGREQTLGVRGRRRDRHLHAGGVHVVGLGRVLMELGRAHAAPGGHADRQGELHRAARPPVIAPDVRDQLVEAGVAEGLVLHLAHRPPARHGQPDRRAEDSRLRQRRVDTAVDAEAVAQAGGRAEDPAGTAHVLAHDHDRAVALHLHVERVVDRLDESPLGH